MEQGILLVIISLILIVIGGVILIVFSLSLISASGAAQFGLKCYFSFAEANVINNFLWPAQFFSNLFLGQNNNLVSLSSASQVQSACLQNSNINGQDTVSFAEEIYSKAASCFNLFQGSNAKIGDQIAGPLDNLFECYSGKIFNSEPANGLSTYNDIINYIDNTYPTNGNPLQIVLITNGSGGTANYTNESNRIFNGSNYIIEYFNYPYSGGGAPQNCGISFQAQCDTVAKFNQPYITPTECEFQNYTTSQTSEPVSSLSNGKPFGSNSQNTGLNICGDFLIPFCGKLINTMVGSQSRVFVCITNSTS
jgi:hypothetical protein